MRLGLLDLYEMADLAQHPLQHGALLVLGAAADLAETERAQRAAMALALADLAADLGDPNLRRHPGPPRSRPPPGRASAPQRGAAPAAPRPPSCRGCGPRPAAGGECA